MEAVTAGDDKGGGLGTLSLQRGRLSMEAVTLINPARGLAMRHASTGSPLDGGGDLAYVDNPLLATIALQRGRLSMEAVTFASEQEIVAAVVLQRGRLSMEAVTPRW